MANPVTCHNPYTRLKAHRYEHRAVVERVVGKPLPPRAVIHHVNDNERDNRPANLVVLQNTTEHTALHYRRRVLRAGGDPWTHHLCVQCGVPQVPAAFYRQEGRPLGHRSICIACCRAGTAPAVVRPRTAEALRALATKWRARADPDGADARQCADELEALLSRREALVRREP